MTTMNTVQQVELKDYKRAALTLAKAFAEDPVTLYFCQHPHTTSDVVVQERNVAMMEYLTYAHILYGEVYQVGDFGAVALWMGPGQNMEDPLAIFRTGMWRLYYKFSTEGRRRFFDEFFPLLNDTKAAVLAEREARSWYLVYLGTHPDSRGRGYARKLVEYITSKCDATGIPTYLESSHPQNRVIYEKMGFHYVRSIYLCRHIKQNPLGDKVEETVVKEGEHGEKGMGIELEIMVREPRVQKG